MHEQQLERLVGRLSRSPHKIEEPIVHIFDVDKVVFNQHLTTNLVLGVAEALPERHAVYDSLRVIRDRAYAGRMPVASLHHTVLQYVEQGFFKGLPRDTVRDIAQRLASGLLVSANNFPLEILEILRVLSAERNDIITLAITGAPEEIVLPYCQRLGFNNVISSIYSCGEDGLYTMDRDLEAAYCKGLIMDEMSRQFGFRWDKSIGMGNSLRDLGILQRVAYPFAINPEGDLLDEVRADPRIVYVEDGGERGTRLFRADGERRFHEVAYCDTLPPEVVQLIMLIPGALSRQGACSAH